MEYDFTQYRTALGFQKSKKFLGWMKSKNENLDVHHILGSVHGKKFTDYLVVAIPHDHHLSEVEPHKGLWFSRYLEQAMDNLMLYAYEVLGMGYNEIAAYLPTFEPDRLRDFIIHVHSLDMK